MSRAAHDIPLQVSTLKALQHREVADGLAQLGRYRALPSPLREIMQVLGGAAPSNLQYL